MIKSLDKKVQKLLKRNNKKYISIAIGAVGVLVFVSLILSLTVQRTYDSYSVVKTNPRTDSSTRGYMRHNDKIIKYSEDGITVMNNNFKTIWSASYSFKNPQVVTSDKYIAVADVGGRDIHVYNDNGSLNKIDNSRDICQIEISDTGMVAIMAREKMAYYITIANSTKKYIDIKTRIKEDGYPIDMAFSGDSQKLVTSYMNVNNGEINNYVTFYNFGEVGKNYESKIVKADSYGNVMVPKVEFMDKDTVCIFSVERFIVYAMKEIPEEKFKSEKYPNMIKSVLCNDEYIGLISDTESGSESVLKLYTKDGRKKLTKKFKFNYESADVVNDDIVLNNGTEGLIIRTSGKVKFKGSFKEEVEYIIPYNNRERFIFITPQNIERVKFTN